MNAVLGYFLFDGGLAEHWPDIALAALFPFAIWLFKLFISTSLAGMEKRHARAEDKFEDHGERIVRLEANVDIGKRIERLAEAIERQRGS